MTFSPDGNYVSASGKVWRRSDGQFLFSCAESGFDPVQVVFTPNSQELLCSGTKYTGTGQSGLVVAQHVPDGQKLYTLASHKTSGGGLTVSPDGSTFVTVGAEVNGAIYFPNQVKWWRASDGQLLRTWDGTPAIPGVGSVTYSRDGHTLAVIAYLPGDYPQPTELQLWNADTGEKLKSLPGGENPSSPPVFSPDGQVLYAGSATGTVLRWNMADGTPLTSFTVSTQPILAVEASPNGERLAVSAGKTADLNSPPASSNITLLQSATGGLVLDVALLTGGVRSLAFSPDGNTLAAAGGDFDQYPGRKPNVLKFWRTSDGVELPGLTGSRLYTYDVTASRDGRYVASAGGQYDSFRQPFGEVNLWDAANGTPIQGWSNREVGGKLQFSPDGSLLALGSGIDAQSAVFSTYGNLSLWQTASGNPAGFLPLNLDVKDIDFSPDGSMIAAALGGSVFNGARPVWFERGQIAIWKTSDLSPLQSLDLPAGRAYNVAFSPDGTLLATSEVVSDAQAPVTVYRINLRSVSDLKSSRLVEETSDEPVLLRFSPNGQLLAVLDRAQNLKIRWVVDGQLLQTIKVRDGEPLELRFSGDGQSIIAGIQGSLQRWRVSDGALLDTVEGLEGDRLELFPGQDRIVWADYLGDTVGVSDITSPSGAVAGDLNGDHALDIIDARILLQSILLQHQMSVEQRIAADMNGDGKLNILDVIMLLRKVVGL